MPETVLLFLTLSERHIGITSGIGMYYAEAAGVCLDRHHLPPTEFTIRLQGIESRAMAHWTRTDERTRRAWANETDTTEAGAYGIALAAVELSHGFYAIHRAETGTGADYYIAPVDSAADNLENCFRLEVSGVDRGDEQAVRQRLREKVQQAINGNSNLPAIAAVVGLRAKVVALAEAAPL